jgi:2-(1,2-epoxy-1,2-dihydrophenyl)acetyl-CoA isomerase
MQHVLFEQRGAVALITLNRPEALNAFVPELGRGISTSIQRCAEAEAIRAVVLVGAGRGFSAGADLKADLHDASDALEGLREHYNPAIRAIHDLPKPVIAAVHGFAAGIGLSLALACDLVFMAESAFMQVPFSRLGLVPDGGLCWELADRLGPRRAFELAAFGERLPASRCEALGLANRIVSDADLMQQVSAAAEQLAHGAALALAGTKNLLRDALRAGSAESLLAETQWQARCLASVDFREGLRAFAAKETPRFGAAPHKF